MLYVASGGKLVLKRRLQRTVHLIREAPVKFARQRLLRDQIADGECFGVNPGVMRKIRGVTGCRMETALVIVLNKIRL